MTVPPGRHRLSSTQLTAIAWGKPDAETIRVLHAAADSRQRLLATEALRRSDGTDSAVLDALAILHVAQRHDDRTITELFRTGWLGTWAAGLLKQPKAVKPVGTRLSALAAVAALRTGIDARLAVHVDDGALHLPGIGTLTVDDPADVEVILESRGGRLDLTIGSRHLRLPTGPAPGWAPVRVVRDGALQLLFDDQHPDRDCFEERPAPRLPETSFHPWRDTTTAAWRLLTRVAPASARQVARGLWGIVPLAAMPHGTHTSISCVNAFGAMATTAPDDPVHHAVVLVHEWSHSLLNGIAGFVDLHEPVTARSPSHFAPWRPDPRPISGLLHGTFAFLAVAETWKSFLAHDGAAERAAAELALRRLQLAEVLATLPAAPELTEQGRRFVSILRRRNAALMDTPLPPRVVAAAATRLDDQRAAWVRHAGS